MISKFSILNSQFSIINSHHYFAGEIEGDGAGEEDVGIGFAGGVKVDLEVATAGDDFAVAGDNGTCRHASATGPGLILHATLVGADEEAAVGKVLDEVDIRPFREFLFDVADTAALPNDIEMLQIVDTLHVMRRASVEKPAAEAAAYLGTGNIAHPQTDDADVMLFIPHQHVGLMGTIEADEREMSFVAESKTMSESGDAAAAIAAHRTKTPVAVIVFHFEIVFWFFVSPYGTYGATMIFVSPYGTYGATMAQSHQAIGAYAETAVANMGNLCLSELRVIIADINQDKIIARTIVFIEV